MELTVTSLIPTVVELISFWQHHFPTIGWYPYWYLGVPYRFLIGPIIPALLSGVYILFPISIEILYISLLGAIWIFGGLGTMLFIQQFGIGPKKSFIAASFFVLFPAALVLLGWGSGLPHMTTALLPWVFLSFVNCLKKWRLRSVVIVLIFLTTILFTHIASILPVLIGFLTLSFGQPTDKRVETLLKAGLLLVTSFALATIWYSPRYWLVLLSNPSFAGKPLASVIQLILQLAQAGVPVLVGLWVVQKRYRLHNKLTQFAVVFGGSFLFMTLIRFLADIDFWQDWTVYGLELQFALALLFPTILKHRFIRTTTLPFITLTIILLFTITDILLIKHIFFNVRDSEYKKEVLSLVEQVTEGGRVFTTGSPVFWLGYERSLLQVRGGRDQAATHKTWADGAYQIREGESSELLKSWLGILGVSWVLTVDSDAREPFKDLKHSERFESLNSVKEISTGRIMLYKSNGSLAYTAEAKVASLTQPSSGNDSKSISNYAQMIHEPLVVEYKGPTKIDISGEIKRGEVIVLAVTYDANWHIQDGAARIMQDAFGNMIVEPLDLSITKWSLVYQDYWFSWVGAVASVAGFTSLLRVEKVVSYFKRHASTLVYEEINEEENY